MADMYVGRRVLKRCVLIGGIVIPDRWKTNGNIHLNQALIAKLHIPDGRCDILSKIWAGVICKSKSVCVIPTLKRKLKKAQIRENEIV